MTKLNFYEIYKVTYMCQIWEWPKYAWRYTHVSVSNNFKIVVKYKRRVNEQKKAFMHELTSELAIPLGMKRLIKIKNRIESNNLEKFVQKAGTMYQLFKARNVCMIIIS